MTSVPDSSLNAARQALAAYAQCSPAAQADIDRVMRALVEHNAWYVPTIHAQRAWGQSSFDEVLDFPEPTPSGMLTVFTDREAALRAEGYPIGPCGGPID